MRYLFLMITALLVFSGCDDQTALEQFNCGRCGDWQTCNVSDGRCDLIEGRCSDRSDCMGDQIGQICVDHSCIDGCKSNSDCKEEINNHLCDLDETSDSYGMCVVSECMNHSDCSKNSDSKKTMCQLDIDDATYLTCVVLNCSSNDDCTTQAENKFCNTDITNIAFGQCYKPECLAHSECSGAKKLCQLDPDQSNQYTCIAAECDTDEDCSENLDTSGNVKCEIDPDATGFGHCYRPKCINDSECDSVKSRCDTENYAYECAYPLSEGCDPKEDSCTTIKGDAGLCLMDLESNNTIKTMCYSEDELDQFIFVDEGASCRGDADHCQKDFICNQDSVCQNVSFDERCTGYNIPVTLNLYTGVEEASLCGCDTHSNCSVDSFCLSESNADSSYDRYCVQVLPNEENPFCPDSSRNNEGICERYSEGEECMTALNTSFDETLNQCVPEYCDKTGEFNCSGYSACDLTINACVPYMMPMPQISPGDGHICAILADKNVKCVGNPENIAAEFFDETGVLKDVKMISSGKDHSCVVNKDQIYCWGKSNHNEVTLDNSDTSIPYHVEIEGFIAVKVVAKDDYSCALGQYYGVKSVFCWGENKGNMLNDGGVLNVPTEITFLEGENSVAPIDLFGSNSSICVLDQFHKTHCLGGMITDNQIELNGVNSDGKPIHFIQGSVGDGHVCMLAADHNVYCVGDGSNGQMGHVNGENATNIGTPITTSFPLNFKQITSGSDHSCALTMGSVYCWGRNNNNQIGETNMGALIDIPQKTHGIKDTEQLESVDASIDQTCISYWVDDTKSERKFYCWGKLYNDTKESPTTISFE